VEMVDLGIRTFSSLPPSPISRPLTPLTPVSPIPSLFEPAIQPFSLWDYLREELLATDFDSHQELKWDRVSNFFSIPVAIEKVWSTSTVVSSLFTAVDHRLRICPLLGLLPLYFHHLAYPVRTCMDAIACQYALPLCFTSSAFAKGRYTPDASFGRLHHDIKPTYRREQNISFHSRARHYQTVCSFQRT
jgi:hypothetical protein